MKLNDSQCRKICKALREFGYPKLSVEDVAQVAEDAHEGRETTGANAVIRVFVDKFIEEIAEVEPLTAEERARELLMTPAKDLPESYHTFFAAYGTRGMMSMDGVFYCCYAFAVVVEGLAESNSGPEIEQEHREFLEGLR